MFLFKGKPSECRVSKERECVFKCGLPGEKFKEGGSSLSYALRRCWVLSLQVHFFGEAALKIEEKVETGEHQSFITVSLL
jgi:hypothetical protein